MQATKAPDPVKWTSNVLIRIMDNPAVENIHGGLKGDVVGYCVILAKVHEFSKEPIYMLSGDTALAFEKMPIETAIRVVKLQTNLLPIEKRFYQLARWHTYTHQLGSHWRYLHGADVRYSEIVSQIHVSYRGPQREERAFLSPEDLLRLIKEGSFYDRHHMLLDQLDILPKVIQPAVASNPSPAA